jgi:hypothetical protein
MGKREVNKAATRVREKTCSHHALYTLKLSTPSSLPLSFFLQRGACCHVSAAKQTRCSLPLLKREISTSRAQAKQLKPVKGHTTFQSPRTRRCWRCREKVVAFDPACTPQDNVLSEQVLVLAVFVRGRRSGNLLKTYTRVL